MSGVRIVVAAAIAGSLWWGMVAIGERYEPGRWFWFPMMGVFLFGPAVAALVAAAPQFRGRDMTAPGVAAACIPPLFVWLFLLPWSNSDGTAVKVFMLMPLVIVALAGALVAWATGVTMAIMQGDDLPPG